MKQSDQAPAAAVGATSSTARDQSDVGDAPRVDSSAGDQTRRAPDRRLRSGLLTAVVLAFALSLIGVLSIKPFRPADENSHVGYAQSIIFDGRLPLVGETVDPILPFQYAGPQHTANHPPLFYLLEAPVLGLGEAVNWPLLGFFAGRALSALFGGLTVLLSGLLAFALTARRRPRVAIAAAVYVATFTPFVAVASFFHNDSLAAATSTLALLGLVTMALPASTRQTRWAMAAMVVGCVLGLLTRAQNVGTTAVCCVGVVLIAVLRPGRWSWRSVRTGTLQGLLIGLSCVALAGWFYLGNIQKYGDVTGAIAVGDLFGMTPRTGTVVGQLLMPGTWLTLLIDQPYWVGHADDPSVLAPVWVSMAVLVIIAIGLLLWTITARGRTSARSASPLVAVRFLLGALILLHVVEGAVHVLDGGNLHGRYMFGAIGVVSTVAAVGLLAVPTGRRGVLVVALALLQAGLTLRYFGFLDATATSAEQPPDTSTPDRIIAGLQLNGVPAPAVVFWLLIAVVVAAIAWLGYLMWRADERVERVDPSITLAG